MKLTFGFAGRKSELSDVVGSVDLVPTVTISWFFWRGVRRVTPEHGLLDILVTWHHLGKIHDLAIFSGRGNDLRTRKVSELWK